MIVILQWAGNCSTEQPAEGTSLHSIGVIWEPVAGPSWQSDVRFSERSFPEDSSQQVGGKRMKISEEHFTVRNKVSEMDFLREILDEKMEELEKQVHLLHSSKF